MFLNTPSPDGSLTNPKMLSLSQQDDIWTPGSYPYVVKVVF